MVLNFTYLVIFNNFVILYHFKWGDNKIGESYGAAHLSVHKADFKILEPNPFSPLWFSHKLNRPGLRYEVSLGIKSGRISSANVPYLCSTTALITIHDLLSEAGTVWKGFLLIEAILMTWKLHRINRGGRMIDKAFYGHVSAKHETVNGELSNLKF